MLLYDENIKTTFTPQTGRKRDKKVKNISWLHSRTELYDSEKPDLLIVFGEHLISTADYKYIGVVESEKRQLFQTTFGKDWIFLRLVVKVILLNCTWKDKR